MDWSNERYIRLYTRDSGDWLMWPWQTRALLVFILRKVDRSGLLHLGKARLYALAAIVGMPSQDVTEWIEPLIDDGCVQIRDGVLCVPNFMAAQETMQTDRARQRASREKARSKYVNPQERATDQVIAPPTEVDPVCHAPSRAVTDVTDVTFGHSDPCLAVPSLAERETREPEAERPKLDPVRSQPPDPIPPPPESIEPPEPAKPESGYDLARRVFAELWAAKYGRPFPFDPFDASPKSEKRVLQAFGCLAIERGGTRAEEYARHWVKAFLREHGDRNWLDEHSHPARTLMRDVAKFTDPPEPKSLTKLRTAQPAEPVAPALSAAEVAAKLAASGIGKIGMGGSR